MKCDAMQCKRLKWMRLTSQQHSVFLGTRKCKRKTKTRVAQLYTNSPFSASDHVWLRWTKISWLQLKWWQDGLRWPVGDALSKVRDWRCWRRSILQDSTQRARSVWHACLLRTHSYCVRLRYHYYYYYYIYYCYCDQMKIQGVESQIHCSWMSVAKCQHFHLFLLHLHFSTPLSYHMCIFFYFKMF